MERIVPTKRPGFRELEKKLTQVIAAETGVFVLMLIFAAFGVTWLKVLLGIAVMAVSALGCALLILMKEYRRKRSWWLLSAFGSLFVCTLVSLIVGYPAPPVG